MLGVPTITLIHEFGAYIRPIQLIEDISLWTSQFVFSSQLTKNDLIKKDVQ